MKNVEYYLNKGFDQRTAEYFATGRRKIVSVLPEENYVLKLCFDNEEQRLLDIKSIIRPDTIFAFLEDDCNFRRVYLDDESNVAWDIDPQVDSRKVWSNKVDLSSDACYMDSIPLKNGTAAVNAPEGKEG